MPSPLAEHWLLDPAVAFLNHGSFGACPRAVLDEQTRLRARVERQPVQFFARDLEGLLDEARAELAAFLGAQPGELAFVPNATSAVNAVVRSLALSPGDELLTTSQAYNACNNVLDYVAERSGARVRVARLPWPIDEPERALEAVLAEVSAKTRLALVDHIASPTGLVLPLARIVDALRARGVETLVDGAHAPGQVPLDLASLGAAYYTGNCHKWLFAPKGAAFLHVRHDLAASVRPAVISHGANSRRTDRPRFLLEFDWCGTDDFTPYLCVTHGIRFGASLFAGGWPELMATNRALALDARALLCARRGVPPPCPDAMVAALAAVPLPDGAGDAPASALYADPLQRALLVEHGIEVPLVPFPSWPRRLARISAQAYNTLDEYQRLADALEVLLGS